MDTSQLVRDAIGSLTAANVAIRHGHPDHAIAQLDAAAANLSELRRLAEESIRGYDEAQS